MLIEVVRKVQHHPTALVPTAFGVLHVGNVDAIITDIQVIVLSIGIVVEFTLGPQDLVGCPNTDERVAHDVILMAL